MGRWVAIAGLVVGFVALATQFAISIPARMANGHDLLDALVFFFTYFTILTNLMLIGVYLSTLVKWRWLDWWRSPVTRGMMAGAIALVMVFYHFLLAGLWAPEGVAKAADMGLHYATPLIYIAWWLAFQPKGGLKFGDIPLMLLPVALWLVWAMVRGAVVNEYPYPILEANKLGYGPVALNCLIVLTALVALYAMVIFIDRAVARRKGLGYSGR